MMKLHHLSLFTALIAMLLVFASPAGASSKLSVGDQALTLEWSAVKGAAGYRVSWRGRVLKDGKPTAVWSTKWLGSKVLKAKAKANYYKAAGLVNGSEYQLRLESKAKAKKSRWVVRSTSVASPKAGTPNPGTYAIGDTGPGGGKVFYAPGIAFTETGAACGSSCLYLEVAPAGWNPEDSGDPGLKWGGGNGVSGQCSNKMISGAGGTAIGSGKANTDAIILACPSTDPSDDQSAPAALAASAYAPRVGGAVVTGWFLPSKAELNTLDLSSVVHWPRPGCGPCAYWSSSQFDASNAWVQGVGLGGGFDWQSGDRKQDANTVRPIRAF